MADSIYMRDIEAMTPGARREYVIGLEVRREHAEDHYYRALGEIITLRAEVTKLDELNAEKDRITEFARHVLSQYGVKEPCNAFHIESGTAMCWGTKEGEPCSCGGDKTRCTHYPRTGTGAHEAGM